MGPALAMTELGLDLRPPICTSRLLGGSMWGNVDVGNSDSSSSGVAKMEEYLRCLEEERRKIDAFKRELPLCMIILTDVIDNLKEELMQCKRPILEQFMPISTNKSIADQEQQQEQRQQDKEEGSAGDGSVAIKSNNKDAAKAANEKMDWMMSAQLWSDNSSDCNTDTYSNSNTNNISSCYKDGYGNNDNYSVASKRNQDERGGSEADRQSESGNTFASCGDNKYRAAGGGAFLPFNKALSSSQPTPGAAAAAATGGRKDEEKPATVPASPSLPVDLSLVTSGLNSKSGSSQTAVRLPDDYRSSCASASSKIRTFVSPHSNNVQLNSTVQSQQQGPRKARRCWSPELHRRFVSALQQLGGSQVATPKQIRELMKVDGLTNDEVKSHLQKYRLHTRRPAPPSTSGSAATQPPVVMLGGLWVSSASTPEECVTVAGSKQNNSVSGSPQGPLQLVGASRGLSFTGVDSCEEEDGKSESYSWRGCNNQRLGEEETD